MVYVIFPIIFGVFLTFARMRCSPADSEENLLIPSRGLFLILAVHLFGAMRDQYDAPWGWPAGLET
jgi:hypothetical protein